jgi:hypothetical protein
MSKRALVFEILGGVFGWIWIGSAVATIVLVLGALFAQVSWWNVGYAVGVGAIAKWLARGFIDNQKREQFEQSIVAKGASKKDAEQNRIPGDVGKSENAQSKKNRQDASERERVVTEYGAFMERESDGDPMDIRDVRTLPHEKSKILDALCLEIVREPSEERLNALQGVAMFLARYQEGVGERPLSLLGFDPSNVAGGSLSDDQLMKLAETMSSNPDKQRHDTYRPLVEKDFVDIQAKLRAALHLRGVMPEHKKTQILG